MIKKIIFMFVLVMNNNKPVKLSDLFEILKKDPSSVVLVLGAGILLIKVCVDYHTSSSKEYGDTMGKELGKTIAEKTGNIIEEILKEKKIKFIKQEEKNKTR